MTDKKIFQDPFLGWVKVEHDTKTGGIKTVFIKGEKDEAERDGPVFTNDYIMRESGLEKLWQRNNRLSIALTNPADFLKGKNEDIKNIGADLNSVYLNELSRLIGLGYPNDKARDLAKDRMMDEKKRRLEVHEQEWPVEIEKLVRTKLGNPLK